MIQFCHMKKSIPMIVGNWKLNPATLEEAKKLAQGVAQKNRKVVDAYIAIAPASIHLSEVGKKISKSSAQLAAQSVSFFDGGAHTGDVSMTQLKDLGVSYVIVGHSERRAAGTTDDDVQKKITKILKANVTPVICIGEKNRDCDGKFFNFVSDQLRSLSKVLSSSQIKKVVIAYEPIWAIGTGKTATAEDVKEMQIFIESVLTKLYDRPTARKVRLLYGGSVKPHNAAVLHSEGGMNGFLVGGASLKAEDFTGIIKAVI